ncbi:MAG: hypothetical protein KF729_34595 [Sandaracinaceae bacterium]|nr:hypothetical protein [Sandaracinaceae bacterium]
MRRAACNLVCALSISVLGCDEPRTAAPAAPDEAIPSRATQDEDTRRLPTEAETIAAIDRALRGGLEAVDEAVDEASEPDGAPDDEPAPPDRAAFEALWGRLLRIDEVAPLEGRRDAVEYRITVLAARGLASIGLHASWPRMFPEELTIEACARGAARRIDGGQRRLIACQGDRVVLRVPVASPPPEWTEGLTPATRPAEGALRLIGEPGLPAAIRALAPELGEARTSAAGDAVRVTYWMRARAPGAVAIALPLHVATPVVRVIERGAPLTERADLTASPEPAERELRVGDEIAIGYLRP